MIHGCDRKAQILFARNVNSKISSAIQCAVAILFIGCPIGGAWAVTDNDAARGIIADATVDYLAELSKRRRLTSIFSNQQSPFYGVQIGYTNVKRRNLTFLNRDLVRLDLMPAVFGRVYDSSIRSNKDFGVGWRLSVVETISRRGSKLLFTDSSNATYILEVDGHKIYSENAHLSGINGGFYRDKTIQISHLGLTKTFNLISNQFVLNTVTDEYGNSVHIQYERGVVSRVSTSSGRFILINRESNGRIRSAVDDFDRRVTFNYDDAGRLSEFKDIGGGIWSYGYDQSNHLTTITDPRGIEVLNAEFEDGDVSKIQVQHETYGYRYDEDATYIVNGASQSATFWHHGSGLTESIQDYSGTVTRLNFDDQLRVRELSFDGQPVVRIDHNQNQTRTNIIMFSHGGSKHYELEREGERVSRVRTDGEVVASYDYDMNGRVTTAFDNKGKREYEYDDDGRLGKFSADGVQLTFTSDDYGIIREIYRDSILIARFDTDASDRIKSLDLHNDGQHFAAEYEYKPSGLRSQATYYDGELSVDFDYDSVGNMSRIRFLGQSGRIIEDRYEIGNANQVNRIYGETGPEISFEYNDSGQPILLQQDNRTAEIFYDDVGRLISVDLDDEQLFELGYGPMDQDAVLKADQRSSRTIVDKPVSSSIFGSIESIAYARPMGSPHRLIQFDPDMVRYIVNEFPVVAPDAVELASIERRMLPIQDGSFNATPLAFDKPSNALFVPPEFQSSNCFICIGTISAADIEVNGSDFPTFTNVGKNITFDVTADGLCVYTGGNPPASFRHSFHYGDGTGSTASSGIRPNASFTHAYSKAGIFIARDVIKCTCAVSPFGIDTAYHTVVVTKGIGNPEVHLALTFDDGPHVTLSGRTITVINTLASRSLTYAKHIRATFFVERQRIDSTTGISILQTMKANGHEIALHGVDPVHHKRHQDTTDLPNKLAWMVDRISAEVNSIAKHVRPPNGWGGWTSGTVYSKNQVTSFYGQAGLTRFASQEATGGVNSWFGGAYSRTGACTGCVSRTEFVGYARTAIDQATSTSSPKRILLLHDIRSEDSTDIGGIIDEIESYAITKNVTVKYVPVTEL